MLVKFFSYLEDMDSWEQVIGMLGGLILGYSYYKGYVVLDVLYD